MKIIIAVSHDVLFKPLYVYRLLLRLHEHDVVAVYEVRAPKNKSTKRISPVRFWGLYGFVSIASLVIIKKLISALPFPRYIRSLSTVKRVSALFGIKYQNISNINSDEFVSSVSNFEPDVFVSFQHQIIREPLLSLKSTRFINCHPSLLPEYRGVKPIFWAMLNRESEFGVSVHEMNAAIDTGKILSQKKVMLRSDWSLFQNYIAAYDVASDVTIQAIENIDSSIDLVEVDSDYKYYHMPTAVDVELFQKRGNVTL